LAKLRIRDAVEGTVSKPGEDGEESRGGAQGEIPGQGRRKSMMGHQGADQFYYRVSEAGDKVSFDLRADHG